MKSRIYNFYTFRILVRNLVALLGSGQDGGIGRNALLPCTTERRITTNLKTNNNQKCQKIKCMEL